MDIGSLHFLIAEDQSGQRLLLRAMLQSLGARHLSEAPDGGSALRHLAGLSGRLDIICTDIDMPGMDGLAFIRHLATLDFKGSLILVSALEEQLLASVATMTTAYGIRLLGTLKKPVTPQKLRRLIALHQADGDERTLFSVAMPAFGPEEMSEALARGEFVPFFQPKVDVFTGRTVGVEALARWRHGTHGIIAPANFIGEMEKSGLIETLTLQILRETVRFCVECRNAGIPTSAAVNLSLACLHQPDVAEKVIHLVQDEGVAPRALTLEVTETAAVTDIAKVLENLARLRINGFGLSIDDYGTGYSSMQQLTRISFTELKIDRSFVTNAAHSETGRIILESSIAMCRRLRIKPVAEGVETTADLAVLRDLRCDFAQGYLFAEPMDADLCIEWIKERRAL